MQGIGPFACSSATDLQHALNDEGHLPSRVGGPRQRTLQIGSAVCLPNHGSGSDLLVVPRSVSTLACAARILFTSLDP